MACHDVRNCCVGTWRPTQFVLAASAPSDPPAQTDKYLCHLSSSALITTTHHSPLNPSQIYLSFHCLSTISSSSYHSYCHTLASKSAHFTNYTFSTLQQLDAYLVPPLSKYPTLCEPRIRSCLLQSSSKDPSNPSPLTPFVHIFEELTLLAPLPEPAPHWLSSPLKPFAFVFPIAATSLRRCSAPSGNTFFSNGCLSPW